MNGERILYVVLIIIAIIIGIYGTVLGRFTPHHYYTCNDKTSIERFFYINEREDYLIDGNNPKLKFQLVSTDQDNSIYTAKNIDYSIKFKKTDETFEFVDENGLGIAMYTCKVTKQFLQRQTKSTN
tara:strand:- start:681 stop:1058 length:378 start_codon:yes stop_codon:yes gene_type:complete